MNEELKVSCREGAAWARGPRLTRPSPRSCAQRAFAVSSAGIEGSKNLAESAKDLERTRKAIALQLADFEGSKRSLMRDLQNRCEKVRTTENFYAPFWSSANRTGPPLHDNRWSNSRSSWTTCASTTTRSSRRPTQRTSRRRWPSSNATSSRSRSCRSRSVLDRLRHAYTYGTDAQALLVAPPPSLSTRTQRLRRRPASPSASCLPATNAS